MIHFEHNATIEQKLFFFFTQIAYLLGFAGITCIDWVISKLVVSSNTKDYLKILQVITIDLIHATFNITVLYLAYLFNFPKVNLKSNT